MKQTKFVRAIIYLTVAVVVFCASLYVCNTMKREEAIDLDTIAKTPGTYYYNTTILGVDVSDVVVKVDPNGVINLSNHNKPALFLFPTLLTAAVMSIVVVVTILLRRLSKKIEI